MVQFVLLHLVDQYSQTHTRPEVINMKLKRRQQHWKKRRSGKSVPFIMLFPLLNKPLLNVS